MTYASSGDARASRRSRGLNTCGATALATILLLGSAAAQAEVVFHRGNIADPATLDPHHTSATYEANVLLGRKTVPDTSRIHLLKIGVQLRLEPEWKHVDLFEKYRSARCAGKYGFVPGRVSPAVCISKQFRFEELF